MNIVRGEELNIYFFIVLVRANCLRSGFERLNKRTVSKRFRIQFFCNYLSIFLTTGENIYQEIAKNIVVIIIQPMARRPIPSMPKMLPTTTRNSICLVENSSFAVIFLTTLIFFSFDPILNLFPLFSEKFKIFFF